MGIPYQNTISSLLQKRDELMRDAKSLRGSLAVVGNYIEALDRTLETLGYKGDLKTVVTRGDSVVFFHRNELRRFCLDELRKATIPASAGDLAEKIIDIEGKDPRDRRLRNDMVKRVGKSLLSCCASKERRARELLPVSFGTDKGPWHTKSHTSLCFN